MNVLMEAASWDPPTIMYMSRRHGLMSGGIHPIRARGGPQSHRPGQCSGAAMVVELGGGVLDGVIDEIAVEAAPSRSI